MGKIIELVYKATAGAEDLFYCSQNKKVYIRQPSNGNDLVFWLTSSKWTGGYEADTPIKAGTTIRVLDKGNEPVFEEVLVKDDWNSGTSADKSYPFSYEEIKTIAKKYGESRKLHHDWRLWLLAEKEQFKPKEYDDNWLYCYREKLKSEVIAEEKYIGGILKVVQTGYRHTVSGKQWKETDIISADGTVVAIGGEQFGCTFSITR